MEVEELRQSLEAKAEEQHETSVDNVPFISEMKILEKKLKVAFHFPANFFCRSDGLMTRSKCNKRNFW